jgi:MFS superfamily sulfate permease-like transporter
MVLLGVVNGMGIAVALAVLAFLWRAWRPYTAVLGRVDRVTGYTMSRAILMHAAFRVLYCCAGTHRYS